MVRERGDRGERPAEPLPPRTSLSVAELRQLISLMNGTDVEEISIEKESDGLRLVLRKPAPLGAARGAAGPRIADEADFAEEEAAAEETVPPAPTQVEVRSPLVGVYRTSMKAGSKALVRVGDVVREGQVVAAVEALNVFNEVEASTGGRVTDILVSDGTAVEYGQPLLVVEPVQA